MGPTSWREMLFGIHYDFHAEPGDRVGARLTTSLLAAELRRLGADWIQCDCKGVPGYLSYQSKFGPVAPHLVNDQLRIHRDVTESLGMPLLVHFCGLWDQICARDHPEWARREVDGSADRTALCMLSPYRDQVMIPLMLELIDDYSVDGFWVDADGILLQPCYCDRCRNRFVSEGGGPIPDGPGDEGWMPWATFHRSLYQEHVNQYVDAVHQRDPRCSVVVNWMGSLSQPDVAHPFLDHMSCDIHDRPEEGILPSEWAEAECRFLDGQGISWDVCFWSHARPATARAQAWRDVKPVAQLCQEAAVALAVGGAAMFYCKPQRSGHLVDWYQRHMSEVATFCQARREVVLETESLPQVAVLHGLDHLNSHRGRWLYWMERASDPLQGAVQALLDLHFHVDVIDDRRLLENGQRYALIVVPEQVPLADKVQEFLWKYVRQGGRVLLSGSNIAQDYGQVLGLTPAGNPLLLESGPYYVPTGDLLPETAIVNGPWQPVESTEGQALLPLLDNRQPGPDDDTGWPAATLHGIQGGFVCAVHGPLFAEYWSNRFPRTRRVIGSIIDALAPPLALEVDGPRTLHVSLRKRAGTTIVHLVNMNGDGVTSSRNVMVEEVPPIGPITIQLKVDRRPVAVRTVPDDRALTSTYSDGTLTIEVARVEIHLAIVVEGANV